MERHPMRRIQEVLRLHFDSHLSQRQISASTGMSKGTVGGYLKRAAASGLTWEEARGMDDHAVEGRLFRMVGQCEPPSRVPIDFPWVHQELRKSGVTLMLLWNEYVEASRQGPMTGMAPYGYSQFCDLFARYQGQVDLTMRQEHRAGEKVFIDYSGKKPCFHDMATGEVIEVELYVGVLGASNFTFAEATRTQTKPDFCASTVRMFEYFGATPIVVVPDQLRSAVKGPDRYDPEINPTYADLARHYEVAIVPARAGEPRDKAKVEGGVRIAQRWILACLRNRVFFGLEELNAAIGELLVKLNNRPFKKLDGCRRSAFEGIDRPAMKALPATRWQYVEHKQARVNIDYHVELDGRLYSAPYTLVRELLDLRFTASVVELFHRGKRVATHARLWSPKGSASTQQEHRPKHHRDYGEWSPSRLIAWATTKGTDVGALVEHILQNRPYPEHAYRSCMAIIRDAKAYSPERYNAACRRALQIGSPTRFSLRSILKKGLDHAALPDDVDPPPGPLHENVRGAEYYDRKETEQHDRRRNDRETDANEADRHGPVFQEDPGPCAGGSTDLV
jgi:transposase